MKDDIKKTYTLLMFQLGFVACEYGKGKMPSTMDEVYDIIRDIGMGIEKGDSLPVVEKKIDAFVKSKSYERAMKIL